MTTAVLSLVLLFPGYSPGQSVEDVSRLLDDSDMVEWSNSYRGLVNALHAFDLHLAYDGQSFAGMVEYTPELRFELAGRMIADTLVLQEIDSSGRSGGYLAGIFRDDRFDGRWWSADNERTARMTFKRADFVEVKSFEPALVFVEGPAQGIPFSGNLMIESEEIVSAVVWTGSSYLRLLGNCQDRFCRRIELQDSDSGRRYLFDRTGQARIDLEHPDDQGNVRHISLQVRREFPIVHAGRITHGLLEEFVFPDFGDEGFTKWITGVYKDWRQQENTRAQERRSGNRWITMSFGWVDLYTFKNDLVTGIITFSSDGGTQYRRKAFLFDLESQREASYAELLSSREELTNRIGGDGLEYLVPTENGFVFLSEFDIVSGDDIEFVSTDNLRDDLKWRKLAKRLMN